MTEVRAGVFVFFDLVMAGLDVCAIDDIALSVLATVIGHQAEKGWIITDGGWMAMSRDRGTASQRWTRATASCATSAGRIDGLLMVSANQEHGIVGRRDGGPLGPSISRGHAAAHPAQPRLRHRGAARPLPRVAGGTAVEAVGRDSAAGSSARRDPSPPSAL